MFPLIYGFILISCQSWLTLSSPARYDQRQTGDVNVQIELKDVKVIALVKSDLLDDYMNYDYVYDYADFTLKPITKPTTKSPQTSAESTTVFSSTKPLLTNSSNSLEVTTSSSSITEDKITESAVFTATDLSADDSSILESSTKLTSITDLEDLPGKIVSTPPGPVENSVRNKKPAKRCKGLDKSGRCLRRRLSFLPLAMKVAPELIRSVRKRIV